MKSQMSEYAGKILKINKNEHLKQELYNKKIWISVRGDCGFNS